MSAIPCSAIACILAPSFLFCNGKIGMDFRQALGMSLRRVRKSRGLTQEAFSSVSSRTHMSELERGVIGITVEKLIEIAEVMGVHPLTVLLDSFSSYEAVAPERLLQQIAHEHNETGSYRSNEAGA
ncbi:helix-turn-helix transcriptional regulator [Stutzerimonas kunmingensis]|uniref:helix-turn-helix domain-containing protein n=1 Tax=Stutzerimonas kunmingensis TaxID=1211807 RepID=UPI003119980E